MTIKVSKLAEKSERPHTTGFLQQSRQKINRILEHNRDLSDLHLT
jgi:hypothetical protein